MEENELQKVVGIVSWLPDNDTRETRIHDLCRLLSQINHLWSFMHIYIYAQNWDDVIIAQVEALYQNVHLKKVAGRPGILKARRELRKWLLSTDAQYFILFDDDANISSTNWAEERLLQLMDQNPNGWAFSKHFLPGQKPAKYNPFAHSQLNLCCLSRYIFEKEDFPHFDPEKSEAFEDRVYSMTLWCKYPELEFEIPYDIYCTHFKSGNPSTWSQAKKYDWKRMRANTDVIERGLLDLYKGKKSQ